jgi:hypothetical protein
VYTYIKCWKKRHEGVVGGGRGGSYVKGEEVGHLDQIMRWQVMVMVMQETWSVFHSDQTAA